MKQDKTWKNISPLFANMMFGSWYMLVGGLLVLHMSLQNTVLTLIVGNLIAATIFYFIGKIGFELRDSTYEIAKRSFGEHGSRFLVTVLLVLARIGWVGVRAELGGYAIAEVFGISKMIGVTIFTGILIAATIGSFKKLSLYGWIALVGTICLSIIGLIKVFDNYSLNQILDYRPDENWNILQGINIVIISKISFGAIVPDFFRNAKSSKDVFLGSFVGFVPAGLIAGTIGAILTITTGIYDLVEILKLLSLSLIAFSFLAVSSFAPATLFPAGVGMASIFSKKSEEARRYSTIVAGIMGLLLSLFGMIQRFVEFLNVLGIVFAPIIGVIIAEYYVLKKSRKVKLFNFTGIISWVLGALVVFVTSEVLEFGVAALNGICISSFIFILITKLFHAYRRVPSSPKS